MKCILPIIFSILSASQLYADDEMNYYPADCEAFRSHKHRFGGLGREIKIHEILELRVRYDMDFDGIYSFQSDRSPDAFIFEQGYFSFVNIERSIFPDERIGDVPFTISYSYLALEREDRGNIRFYILDTRSSGIALDFYGREGHIYKNVYSGVFTQSMLGQFIKSGLVSRRISEAMSCKEQARISHLLPYNLADIGDLTEIHHETDRIESHVAKTDNKISDIKIEYEKDNASVSKAFVAEMTTTSRVKSPASKNDSLVSIKSEYKDHVEYIADEVRPTGFSDSALGIKHDSYHLPEKKRQIEQQYQLCLADGGKYSKGGLTVAEKEGDSAVLAAKISDGIMNVPAIWYHPSLGDAKKIDYVIDMKKISGKIVKIIKPTRKNVELINADKQTIHPIKYNGLENTIRRKNEGINELKILVIGDAYSIARSGLDVMENQLNKKSINLQYVISILEPDTSGLIENKIMSRDTVITFNDLVITASERKGGKEYSQPLVTENQISNFFKSFSKYLSNSKETVDLVIWVRGNTGLPSNTPKELTTFLKDVHKDGNISRFDNSEKSPRKWFYIITGEMPGSDVAYLVVPFEKSSVRPGYIDQEEYKYKDERRLLAKNSELILLLKNAFMSKNSPSSISGIDKGSVYFNAMEYVDGYKLILPVDKLVAMLSSIESTIKLVGNIRDSADVSADEYKDLISLNPFASEYVNNLDGSGGLTIKMHPEKMMTVIHLLQRRMKKSPESIAKLLKKLSKLRQEYHLAIKNSKLSDNCTHYLLDVVE